MTPKIFRTACLVWLIVAYVLLAIVDFVEGNPRTGTVSMLFAIITWLVFF